MARMQIIPRICRRVGEIFENRFNHKIFFLHVPKCGGTSLNAAIRYCYGVCSGLEEISFHLDSASSFQLSKLTNRYNFQHEEELLIYLMASNNFRYISGHFNYSSTAFREFGDMWDYVTILRHPTVRWFSQYFYNRYGRNGPFKLRMGLEEYIESDVGLAMGNEYISRFVGYDQGIDFRNEEAIKRAIENLKKFKIVGCLENSSAFIERFRDVYGVDLKLPVLRKGPMPKVMRDEKISESLEAKVETICKPDLEVYNYFFG